MSSKNLMHLGLITMRQNPTRMTCNLVTYKHPTVPGLTVSVHPMPTVAGGDFWNEHWYGQEKKFDRVLVEDEKGPIREGTSQARWAQVLRSAVPFTGHSHVVGTDVDWGKYDMAQAWRDRYDGTLAYQSVIDLKDPPVDPRARRAVDHLNTIAAGMEAESLTSATHRVVMPWNVYHCYYLNWRFREEGWTVDATKEVDMINRWEVALTMTCVTFATVISFYTLLKFMGYMLFSW